MWKFLVLSVALLALVPGGAVTEQSAVPLAAPRVAAVQGLPKPEVRGPSLQPADVMAAAYQNVLKLAARTGDYEGEREYARYAWISLTDPRLKMRCYLTVCGHAQGLSRGYRVVPPVLVSTDGSEHRFPNVPLVSDDPKADNAKASLFWAKALLVRFDIRDYRWSSEQWDKLGNADLDFVFHTFQRLPWKGGVWTDGRTYEKGSFDEVVSGLAPWLVEPFGLVADKGAQPGKDVAFKKYLEALIGLSRETGYAQSPIVEADNFVWQTAVDFDRPAGYYSWLGVVDKKSFDKLVRFDPTVKPIFEAISKSGVARDVRAFERYGRGDGYYATKDQVNKRAVRRRNPLNVLDRNKFDFDAFEIYAHLDNGFWAFGLFTDKGVIQQSVPDGIGYFHQSITNDGKIHVYLSCNVCHDKVAGNGGLIKFTPYFRTLWADPGPLALMNFRKSYKRFDEYYLTPLDDLANLDRTQYVNAMVQANGLEPHSFAEMLYESYSRWNRSVDRARAAQLYGVSEDELVRGLTAYLRQYGTIDNVNANWLKDDKARQRIGLDQFAENYPLGHLALRGLPTWPVEIAKRYPMKGTKP